MKFSLFFFILSLFDELESQRRFLLDESVQSAFFKQYGIKVQPREGGTACGQQHGEEQQAQPADKSSSLGGSGALSGGQPRDDPTDSARGGQKESRTRVLPSGSHDSPSSTIEFLDCLF